MTQFFFTGRKPIEGQYSGQHATPQIGQSVEFRDYRQYIPGDEIGSIDWKIYGRSDKLFIKIFEHQADLTVNLLVDASASMAYRGVDDSRRQKLLAWSFDDRKSKYDYACSLAAAIGFLIVKQHDRVGFSLAQGGLSQFLAARSALSHLSAILDAMEQAQPQGEARLADAIRDLAGRTGRREVLIVFSDLLEDRDAILKSLSMFHHRGGEAILFHVLHGDEIRLPQIENGIFIDSETRARVRLNVEDVRTTYEAKLQDFLDSWLRQAKANAINYSLCPTTDPYERVLERYLTRRAVRG
ncbi:MAG TPA: DUF58 domain-containing protein [Planctomycetaceae bacterium]|nr:DUF58 domain-containing protein [Planctomycetaceae bacterium]